MTRPFLGGYRSQHHSRDAVQGGQGIVMRGASERGTASTEGCSPVMSQTDREKHGSRLAFFISPRLGALVLLAVFLIALLLWR